MENTIDFYFKIWDLDNHKENFHNLDYIEFNWN